MIPENLTLSELQKYLYENKQDIIYMKKACVKVSDVVTSTYRHNVADVNKSAVVYSNNAEAGILQRTIVASTYNWVDSHHDVHLNGVFAKSIAERGNRVPLLHDHIFQLDARIGKLTNLQEQQIQWSDLGVEVPGSTESLIVSATIKAIENKKIYDLYLNDEVDQHSVTMQYVNMALAMDSKDYELEYKNWSAYIDLVGNKDKAVEDGYFFAIKEAKLIEVSAVLIGSNELTPTLNNKFQPVVTTDKKSTLFALDRDKLLSVYYNSRVKN